MALGCGPAKSLPTNDFTPSRDSSRPAAENDAETGGHGDGAKDVLRQPVLPLAASPPRRVCPNTTTIWKAQSARACFLTVLNGCCLVALAGVGLLAGCAEFNVADTLPLIDRAPKAKVPARATAMWSDTILNQSGQVGVRGFGGRVMFFEADSEKPITVDGTITVYAFDETGPKVHHTVPRRKFVFPSEQLPEHYSKSALGHSYSLWLPWDEVGRPPQQISLVLRFEGRSGGVLTTDNSRQLLPGIVAEQIKPDSPAVVDRQNVSPRNRGEHATLDYVELAGAGNSSRIELAAHETPAEQPATARQPARPPETETMSTTTIDVPPNFARRNLTTPGYLDVVAESYGPDDAAASRQHGLAPILDERTGQSTHRGTAQPAVNSSDLSASASASGAGAGAASRSARYGLQRSRAQTRPTTRPGDDPVRRQPHPAMWPSALQPTPRQARNGEWSPLHSADPQESN